MAHPLLLAGFELKDLPNQTACGGSMTVMLDGSGQKDWRGLDCGRSKAGGHGLEVFSITLDNGLTSSEQVVIIYHYLDLHSHNITVHVVQSHIADPHHCCVRCVVESEFDRRKQ